MNLRTRLTLVVAAVASVAMLATAALAYIIAKQAVHHQIQADLRRAAELISHRVVLHSETLTRADHDLEGLVAWVRIVPLAGPVRAVGVAANMGVNQHVLQVAADLRPPYFSPSNAGGVAVSVYTTRLRAGEALQVATPVGNENGELALTRTALLVVVAIGVALTAAASRFVARAGLAPVGRLTSMAEQVASTGELGHRVQWERPDELGRLAAALNGMLAALEDSVNAQKQLIADAGHELRTPLTSLRANLELLLDAPELTEPARQHILQRAVSQLDELGRLAADVTQLARGGQLMTAISDVRLDDVVAEALSSARRDWPVVVYVADLEPFTVRGDPAQLRRAVHNLLDNAAKFGEGDNLVEVRLSGGVLTVRDHGVGVSELDPGQLFERFYRAPSARALPGSGLGLAIVRQIVSSHGGEVDIGPAQGGGAIVTVRLPGSFPPQAPTSTAPARNSANEATRRSPEADVTELPTSS